MHDGRIAQQWVIDLDGMRASKGEVVVKVADDGPGNLNGFVLAGSDGTLGGDVAIIHEALDAFERAKALAGDTNEI